MNFIDCCNLVNQIKSKYKLILPYHPTITWSFKFELNCKQYDPVDIIYMHLLSVPKPQQLHGMIPKLPISTKDCVTLVQLSSGTWKRIVPDKDDKHGRWNAMLVEMRERYEQRREEFQSITGIPIN